MSDILERYPILAKLPEDMRAGYAAKADAGLPLSEDECAALGLFPCTLVLVPECGSVMTSVVFGGDLMALREILRGAR